MALYTPTSTTSNSPIGPAIVTPNVANGVISDSNQMIAGLDSRLNGGSSVAPAANSGVGANGLMRNQSTPNTVQTNDQNVAYNQQQNNRTQAAMPQGSSGGTNPTGPVTYWQMPGGATITVQPGQTPPAGSVQSNIDGSSGEGKPTTPISPEQKQQQDLQAGIDQDSQDIADMQAKVASFSNGTYLLTPDEQAQVTNLQNQFQQLINEQRQTNQAYEAGVTLRGIRQGQQGVVASYMGDIKGAIDEGISKIANIESKMSSAVYELREAIKSKDYGYIHDYYTDLKDSLKEKHAVLKDLNDQVRQAKQDKIAADKVIYEQKTKPIQDIALEAAKFGAPNDVVDKINSFMDSGDVAGAMASATGYLQDPTSLGGMYASYQRDQKTAGKEAMSPSAFVSAQKYSEALATERANAAYVYQNAYNAEAARQAFSGSDKNQQKLEKDYSSILLKEFSNRSGGLGLQDQKVNQAIHLKSLLDQYKKTDTKGNITYAVPKAQYAELVLGLANLLSGAGAASEATRKDLMAKTLSGDIRGAVTYLTGYPIKGNADAVIKNLADSIDRQGEVAEDLRTNYMMALRALKPTDLEESRATELEKAQNLSSFRNPTLNAEQAHNHAVQSVQSYVNKNPADFKAKSETLSAYAKASGLPEPTEEDFVQAYPELFK